MKIEKKSSYFFELLPFSNLDIENFDISKAVTASIFKLGQLIMDNELTTWWKLKKSSF